MSNYKVPDNLLYTETHEWLKLEDGTGIIGITDYAQDKLGDVVYVELPEVGIKVNAGDKIGEIESVKTVADLYSPVSGEIIEVNEALVDSPELLNESPYEDGWIFKILLHNKEEINQLLNSKRYLELISHE